MNRARNLSLFLLFTISLSFSAFSQYTETINSNRPGQSQGAFAVGNGVLQGELGAYSTNEEHNLLNYKAEGWGTDFAIRYGFLMEQLEINLEGSYLNDDVTYTSGNYPDFHESGFPKLTAGVKYLIYDPYKKERKINLYSYHANHGVKWRDLVPAVGAYAGINYIHSDNPYLPTSQEGMSPKVMLITQHNWGRFVWTNNFIGDQIIMTDYPTYAWITTMTHSFTSRIAGFVEYQMIKSDIYADDIFRFGGAYLITKDFQVDINALTNFKDTPSKFQYGLGVSYRLDFHDHDELLPTEGSELDRK